MMKKYIILQVVAINYAFALNTASSPPKESSVDNVREENPEAQEEEKCCETLKDCVIKSATASQRMGCSLQ